MKSHKQLFEAVLEFEDLSVQVGAFLEDDAGGHHWALDAAGPAQRGLAFNKAVGDVLLLALRGQRHHHLQRVAVRSQDHRLHLALGDRLEQLVGALAHLAQRQQLLDELEDLLGELGVGDGLGLEHPLGHHALLLPLPPLLLLRLPHDVDELLLLLLHLFQLYTDDCHQSLRVAREGHGHCAAGLGAGVEGVAAGGGQRRVLAAGGGGAGAAGERARQQPGHPAAEGQADRQRPPGEGERALRAAQEDLRPQLRADHPDAGEAHRGQPDRRAAPPRQPRRARDLLQGLPQAAPGRAGGRHPPRVPGRPETGGEVLLRDHAEAHPAGAAGGERGGGGAHRQAEAGLFGGDGAQGDGEGLREAEVRAQRLPGQGRGDRTAGGVDRVKSQADEGSVAAGAQAGRDDRRRPQERGEGQELRAEGRGRARAGEGEAQEEQKENVLHHLPRTPLHRHRPHPRHHHPAQEVSRRPLPRPHHQLHPHL